MGLYFTIRERLRFNPTVNKTVYLMQSLYRSHFGRLVGEVRRARKSSGTAQGVAVCLRFRDEARYLTEWLEYHQAAGVCHFFLYNNFSTDDYRSVLEPWLNAGHVTLVDWSKVPATPAAEEDCVRRALGCFQWVGFLDADEFVVIRDGSSIGDFLDRFDHAPGVCLHWRIFGSSMHRTRPIEPVISAYQRRTTHANFHIKTFLRPERAAQCRNPHSWFYYPIAAAVGEHGNPIFGSIDMQPTTDIAWINHYYCKSAEDYLAKGARPSTQDRVGIKFPTRRAERLEDEFRKNNQVIDPSAIEYYWARCRTLGRDPILLQQATIQPPKI
jgi:hypothetical protein